MTLRCRKPVKFNLEPLLGRFMSAFRVQTGQTKKPLPRQSLISTPKELSLGLIAKGILRQLHQFGVGLWQILR